MPFTQFPVYSARLSTLAKNKDVTELNELFAGLDERQAAKTCAALNPTVLPDYHPSHHRHVADIQRSIQLLLSSPAPYLVPTLCRPYDHASPVYQDLLDGFCIEAGIGGSISGAKKWTTHPQRGTALGAPEQYDSRAPNPPPFTQRAFAEHLNETWNALKELRWLDRSDMFTFTEVKYKGATVQGAEHFGDTPASIYAMAVAAAESFGWVDASSVQACPHEHRTLFSRTSIPALGQSFIRVDVVRARITYQIDYGDCNIQEAKFFGYASSQVPAAFIPNCNASLLADAHSFSNPSEPFGLPHNESPSTSDSFCGASAAEGTFIFEFTFAPLPGLVGDGSSSAGWQKHLLGLAVKPNFSYI